MRSERQALRRAEIEEAAFQVLLEKGYAAASMLSIAKHVGASNETLYRWYGDKPGLFRALVHRNAKAVSEPLLAAREAGVPAAEVLDEVGPKLLAMLTGDRAVALNRAAAADADQTGLLGATLAKAGRDAVRPLIVGLFAEVIGEADAEIATETYLSLLIGDLQTRRIIGVRPAPTKREISARAAHAMHCVRRIYPQF